LGTDRQPHPFGNTRAIWLYAERCGDQKLVLRSWDKLKATYEDFRKSGWTLDGNKGNSFANRYLASMEAMVKLADLAGDEAVKQLAEAQAASTRDALIAWWKRAAQTGTLGTFQSSSELDPFIGKGDGISFAVAPHRHKLALFQDLTPEIAAVLNQKCPEEVRQVWSTFKSLCPTWQYQGEERQVHYGENFVDPPDFALSAFRAATWLQMENLAGLGRLVDQPFCRADLYHFMKTALALERMASE
jgi:hypothetical protein